MKDSCRGRVRCVFDRVMDLLLSQMILKPTKVLQTRLRQPPKLSLRFNPSPKAHVSLMTISSDNNNEAQQQNLKKEAIYELLPGRRRAFVMEMTINSI